MNSPVEINISSSSSNPVRLASAYGQDGNILILDWYSEVLSGFPWMAFLREEQTMEIATFIHIFGIDVEEQLYSSTIVVPDVLGFQMLTENLSFINQPDLSVKEWTKLPMSLAWLYGERPYITTQDLLPVMSDLKESINTGIATNALYKYIDTHAYRTPVSVSAYSSYGSYYDESMLVPHGLPNSVKMKLGVMHNSVKRNINYTGTIDALVLEDNDSSSVEIIIQYQFGTYFSGHRINIQRINKVDKIKEVNLSFDNTLGQEWIEELPGSAIFTLSLIKAYGIDRKFPIYTYSDTARTSITAPFGVLTNAGQVSAPPILPYIDNKLILNGIESTPINGNTLYFGNSYIRTELLDQERIYLEYSIS